MATPPPPPRWKGSPPSADALSNRLDGLDQLSRSIQRSPSFARGQDAGTGKRLFGDEPPRPEARSTTQHTAAAPKDPSNNATMLLEDDLRALSEDDLNLALGDEDEDGDEGGGGGAENAEGAAAAAAAATGKDGKRKKRRGMMPRFGRRKERRSRSLSKDKVQADKDKGKETGKGKEKGDPRRSSSLPPSIARGGGGDRTQTASLAPTTGSNVCWRGGNLS